MTFHQFATNLLSNEPKYRGTGMKWYVIWMYIKKYPPTFSVKDQKLKKASDDWWAALLQHTATLDRELRAIKERNHWQDDEAKRAAAKHSQIRVDNKIVKRPEEYNIKDVSQPGQQRTAQIQSDDLINQAVSTGEWKKI